jgi:hypothetical protein
MTHLCASATTHIGTTARVAIVSVAYTAWCLPWPALRVIAFSTFASVTCGLAGFTFCAGACFDGMDAMSEAVRSMATFTRSHVAHARRGLHRVFTRAAARLAPRAALPVDTPEAHAAPPRAPSHATTSIRRKLYSVFCSDAPTGNPEAADTLDARWNDGSDDGCTGRRCTKCFTVLDPLESCTARARKCATEPPRISSRPPTSAAWAWVRSLDWRRELSRPRPLHADAAGPCPGPARAGRPGARVWRRPPGLGVRPGRRGRQALARATPHTVFHGATRHQARRPTPRPHPAHG